MQLLDDNGHGMALYVADYQFPDDPHPGKRRSWLIVYGTAHCPRGSWSFRWQALTPDDAIDIARWLRQVASGAGEPTLAFIEPALSFEHTWGEPGTIDLDIGFDLEFSPPWDRRPRAGDPFIVSCRRLTPAGLLRAADEWDSEIVPYPP